jgi:phosphoglucomutase
MSNETNVVGIKLHLRLFHYILIFKEFNKGARKLNSKFNFWLTNPYFDKSTQDELQAILNNDQEIEERFYRDLEFGTGGLRGIIGAGTNRMNKYVVRQVTQGLAAYICTFGQGAKQRGVAISHDPRHFSREFALEAALILANNGVKAYLFEDLRPTPELSFAVRELGAIAGIMVTASHNPPEYNGYKVYWEDGGQVPPERADEIFKQIEGITDITSIVPLDLKLAQDRGLLVEIGEEIDRKYLDRIKNLAINPQVIEAMGDKCKILYSPLHGTGNMPIRRVLQELGFEQVVVVPEQELPDPDFSTVKSPNPEEPGAFTLALELAKKENPDVILGTDPDADRIGVVAKVANGEYKMLTGNQTGVLLTYYILSQLKATQKLPTNGVVIKTIVTTDMTCAIAKDFGIEVEQTLTGFKFIGEKIHEYEELGNKTYLFGFEESYGYLAGTFVRDKDAVSAAALIAEATAYYKSLGKTLYGVLEELWAQYGFYQEALRTITLEGMRGKEEMKFLMEQIRKVQPQEFAGHQVAKIEDYLLGQGLDIVSGEKYSLKLPQANVVRFLLVDGGYVVFRPSGTEPKAKIYISLMEATYQETFSAIERAKGEINILVEKILSSFH